jgi:hypothetical protein
MMAKVPASESQVAVTTSTRLLLALLSGGAAAIHVAAIGSHLDESVVFAAFFAAVAVLQAAWSAAILRASSRYVLVAGAVGNAVVVAIWIMSRTVGLPIGPDAGVAEPAGFTDVIVTTFECVIVAATLALACLGSLVGTLLALGTVLAALTIGVVSSSAGADHHGHLHLSGHMGHHLVHLVFVGGGAILFSVYAAADVKKNGWPTFSWRLRPTTLRSRRR